VRRTLVFQTAPRIALRSEFDAVESTSQCFQGPLQLLKLLSVFSYNLIEGIVVSLKMGHRQFQRNDFPFQTRGIAVRGIIHQVCSRVKGSPLHISNSALIVALLYLLGGAQWGALGILWGGPPSTESRSEKGSDPSEESRFHWFLGRAGEGQTPFRIGSETASAETASAETVCEQPKQEQGMNEDSKGWSIAIHGGAGGDPAQWSESIQERRLSGIKRALTSGTELLRNGASAVDVVEAVVRVLEDDPVFNAGKGAVLNADRIAELDASIMDGKTLRCGAVAGVQTVKNPISLARRVMLDTKHVLLIGAGADRFAAQQQVELVTPDYFQLKPEEEGVSLYRLPRREGDGRAPLAMGTVGCVVRDAAGNLAAGTSTGGLSGKMPGRVGDSPVIGAGNYANNATCAVSGTGIGEEYIRHVAAYDVAAQIKYQKKSVQQAVQSVMDDSFAPGTGGMIAVGADGSIALAHNTPGMTWGAANEHGRFEVALRVISKP